MTTSTTSGFYVGDETDPEKYRLVRQVGDGGEATLWLGYLLVGGGEEKVAIKILRPDHAEDFDRLQERWADQVETLRFISDPGVVAVRDWFVGPLMHRQGEAPPQQGRALYLAMNWVEGRSFRDWVAIHDGPAGWIDGLAKLAQVARALDNLHSGRSIPSGRSVTHGDISPGNVMITEEEQAVLVDFGLVRLADHHTSRVMGTPGFAAPEVWSQGHYSPAADRYGFAALGYFALLGAPPPADQAGIYQSLFSHPRLRNAPPSRVAAIMSGFDPDPERRPTAAVWLEAFRDGATTSSRNTMGPSTGSQTLGPVPTASPYPTPAPRPATGPHPGPQPFPGAPVSDPRRPHQAPPSSGSPSRGLLIGLGVGAAVLLVLTAFLLARSGGNTVGGTTPTVAAPTSSLLPVSPSAVEPSRPSGPVNDLTTATQTFSGPVRMTVDGVGIRNGQPDRTASYRLEWRSDNTVNGRAATGSARWDSTGAPSAAQCVEQMALQAYSSSEESQIPFEPGLGLCFTMSGSGGDSYVVFLRLPEAAAQPAIQAEATVWRKPSN